jgi:spore photoproduct lyase
LFVNQQDLVEELADHLGRNATREAVVYHTGELSDALALERWSGFASAAIPLFHGFQKARLELRTKSADVEILLPDTPPENVIVAWTLTPWEAWQQFEDGTPNPLLRLRSARACQDRGYRVGIRLDPALVYPRWEDGYETLIRQVYDHLPVGTVDSFVIGGFRYSSVLGSRIRQRFPSNSLLLEEFVPCRDGKYRYFRPLRVSLYRRIVRAIRKVDPGAIIELCMETGQVRRGVLEAR